MRTAARLLLICLALLCLSADAAAQVGYVQGAPNTTSGSGPFPSTATFTSSVTTGDLFIVWGRFFSGSAGITVSDTCGSSLVKEADGTNSSSYLVVYAGTFACTGSDTITFANGSGSIGAFPEFTGYQYHNGYGSGWTIGTTTGPTTGFQFSPWKTTNFTAGLDDLTIAFFENETGATTGPNGWPAGCSTSVGCGGSGWNQRDMAGQDVFTVDNLDIQTVSPFAQVGNTTGGSVGYFTMNVTPTGVPSNTNPRQRQAVPSPYTTSPPSSFTITFPANVLSGSGLFYFTGSNGVTVTSCTDTLGTTFVAKTVALTFSGYQLDTYFGITTSGGADAITCNYTGSYSFLQNLAVEVQNTTGFDQTNGGSGIGSPMSSGNVTTTQNGETLFGFSDINTSYPSAPLTLGTGFATAFILDDPPGFAAQYYIGQEFNQAIGTYSFSGTYSGFSRNLGVIYTLEGVPSGPTINTQPADASKSHRPDGHFFCHGHFICWRQPFLPVEAHTAGTHRRRNVQQLHHRQHCHWVITVITTGAR